MSSGSSLSDWDVKPARSTKSTDTTRRSSRRVASASEAPHALQNLAPSGFSWPQSVQIDTNEDYVGRIHKVQHRVHHAAGAVRHLRDGGVHPLARFASRNLGARAGRERVRCRVRYRVRPAGGRAAPERPGRRDARGLPVSYTHLTLPTIYSV